MSRVQKESGYGSGRVAPSTAEDFDKYAACELRALADRLEAGRAPWTDGDPFGAGLLDALVACSPKGFVFGGAAVCRQFWKAVGIEGDSTASYYPWLDGASLVDVIDGCRGAADWFTSNTDPSSPSTGLEAK